MFDAPVPTSTANSVARWQAEVEVEHDAPFFWMLRMQHRKDILHLSNILVKYRCESAFVILFKKYNNSNNKWQLQTLKIITFAGNLKKRNCAIAKGACKEKLL